MSQRSPSKGLLTHGSHPHPMVPFVHPSQSTSTLCSICQAVVESKPATSAALSFVSTVISTYVLCSKCFEIDEHSFPSSQYIVRNPMIHPADTTVMVRTRPRVSGFGLAPLHDGDLIEVVAYAESVEEPGVLYFRQRIGGWVNSNHVVAVIPSDRSIAFLATLHLHHRNGTTTHSTTLTAEQATELMEETNALLLENKPFGIVQGYLSCLPLQMALTASAADSVLHERVCVFAEDLLRVVVEELLTVLQSKQFCAYANLSMLVKIIGRSFSLFRHIRIDVLTPETMLLILEAVKVLKQFLMLYRPNATDPQTVYPPVVLWATIAEENSHASTRVCMARSITGPILTTACAILRHPEGPALPELEPIRDALYMLPQFDEALAAALCVNARQRIEEAQQRQMPVAPVQRAVLGLDVVEGIMRILKTSRTEHCLREALLCLHALQWKNPVNVSTLLSIALPQVLHLLRTTSSCEVARAAFDVCTGFTYQPTSHHNSVAPHCTATTSAPAVAQPVVLYAAAEGQQLVALCDSCAAHHPPPLAVNQQYESKAHYQCMCVQCNTCAASTATQQPQQNPPPPTLLQRMFTSSRLSSLMTQWLRSSGHVTANAVGRLAFAVGCAEDVAVALLCSLIELPSLDHHRDAALAVAAVRGLPSVAQLLSRYASSAIAQYVAGSWASDTLPRAESHNYAADSGSTSPDAETPEKDATPAARLKRDYSSGSSQRASVMGLSPSLHLDDSPQPSTLIGEERTTVSVELFRKLRATSVN